MNFNDLTALVARGESEHLEFKRSTGSLSDGMKTVCAMLNGPVPSHVLFGVNDGREIVGQEITTRTLEDVANELRKIEPPAFPDVEQVDLPNSRSALAICVPGGTGLFTYDGRPYHRSGPTTSRMPSLRYEQRLMERLHAFNRWEKWPAEGITVSDLDHREIIRTVEEAIRRQRLDDPGTRDPAELLLGLGLIEDGHVVNAAAVLFGRSSWMLSRFTQCLVRLARFRGTAKTEFVDSRQEVGNAFDLLLRTQEFLRLHLPVAGRILPDRVERVDEPLYPPEAIREALSNALCHRDYSSGAGSIGVAVFDDRLEISSPGSLPFGLTPDDLRQPHPSKPRNLLIAHAFYRRGIVEQWGRGTLKMIELTEQAGLAAPEFEATEHEVIVRFRSTRYTAPTRVSHELSPLQREILEVLARDGPASLQMVRGALPSPTPERTVQDNLQMLRRLGLVDVAGMRRTARWSLGQIDAP